MPETDIGKAVASDLTTAITDFSVDTAMTDGPTDQPETTWMNENWSQYFGYYKDIPELAAVIDAKATWTVGKGFKADEQTTMLLDTIKGNGFDTFNTILENMDRTKEIGGDAYAEIIRDDEGNLINLKPLDPAVMKHVANREGIIIRFEQISKTKQPDKKFKPEKIFYLPRNRVADEIHGNTMTERLAKIILMRNEAMEDWKRVMHRNVDPMIAYKLDTDDTTKIADFKRKVDAAKGKGENMYIPQGSVEFEIISLAPNANLNPLAWIDSLNNYFYQSAGVPQIVLGGTGAITERAVSIAYLAFQQTIEEEQLFIEEQVLSQLNLVIELEFPASLQNDLLSDQKKDGPINIDKSETTATEERA
jgi:hypothetical protein